MSNDSEKVDNLLHAITFIVTGDSNSFPSAEDISHKLRRMKNPAANNAVKMAILGSGVELQTTPTIDDKWGKEDTRWCKELWREYYTDLPS